jgi:hypothetical protein
MPPALPGAPEDGGTPVGSATRSAPSGSGGVSAAEASALERTQTINMSTAGGAAMFGGRPLTVPVGEPLVEPRSRNWTRRIKAAVPYVLLALLVSVIVLAVSNSVAR